MVLKHGLDESVLQAQFENDVKTYGTETSTTKFRVDISFENDVKTYGTETILDNSVAYIMFENDVKTYGTETR